MANRLFNSVTELFAAISETGRRSFWVTLFLTFFAVLFEGVGIVLLIPLLSLRSTETADFSWINSQMAMVYDTFGAQSDGQKLLLILLGFLVLTFARVALNYAQTRRLSLFVTGFANYWRRALMSAVAGAPWSQIMKNSRKGIEQMLSQESDRLRAAASSFMLLCLSVITISVQSVIAFLVAPSLTPIVFLVLLGIGWFLLRFLGQGQVIGHGRSKLNLSYFDANSRLLGGLKQAKVHHEETRFLANFDSLLDRLRDLELRSALFQVRFGLVLTIVGAVIAVASIYVGLIWMKLAVAQIVVLLLIMTRLLGPIRNFFANGASLVENAPVLADLRGRIDALGGDDAQQRQDRQAGSGLLAVSGLGFFFAAGEGASQSAQFAQDPSSAHEPQPKSWLLRDISFRAEKGELVVISGPSGVGKTTLLDLITGLYQPQEGKVEINAPDGIKYLIQNPVFFEENILDLLRGDTENLPLAQIEAMLELVELDHISSQSPEGLAARIDLQSGRLSGGEVQRLALAAALLAKPDILILDEATNAMDQAMEARIIERLVQRPDGPLIIGVSHRDILAKFADQKVVLA